LCRSVALFQRERHLQPHLDVDRHPVLRPGSERPLACRVDGLLIESISWSSDSMTVTSPTRPLASTTMFMKTEP
jgi:hypothetical protein